MKPLLLSLLLFIPVICRADKFNYCTGCVDFTGPSITSSTLPAGSSNYIQNTSSQQNAQFNVDTGTVRESLSVGPCVTCTLGIATFFTDYMTNLSSVNGLTIQGAGNSEVDIKGGNVAGATGNGKPVIISGGQGGVVSGTGGNAQVNAGIAFNGNGGSVSIDATNAAGGTHTGGSLNLQVGSGSGGGANGTYNFTQPGGVGVAHFNMDAVSSNRTFSWPDKTGTMALLSDVILTTSSLQSGATFYVSSGTVAGQLAVNSIKWPDGTIQVSSPTAGGSGMAIGGTITSATDHSVLFASGTALAQDNSSFYYDYANHRLGLGTTSPGATLAIIPSTNSVKGLILKGASSAYNSMLTEWQDYTGSVVGSMGYTGDLIANSFSNSSNPDPSTNGFYFTATSTKRFNFLINSTVSNVEGELLLQRQRGGSYTLNSGDFMGSITPNTMSFLRFLATGDTTGGFTTADMVWNSTNKLGVNADRIRWTAEGKESIGPNAPTPTAMLQVQSTDVSTTTVIVKNIANQTANTMEFQNSAGTPYVTIGPSKLGFNDLTLYNWLNVSGILSTGTSNAGVRYNLTTPSDSTNFNNYYGVYNIMNAGFTGFGYSIAQYNVNQVAGTGTAGITGGQANYAEYASAVATTVGDMVGGLYDAGGGNHNFGFIGSTIRDKNNATNIGATALAFNGGTSPTTIGLWAILSNGPSVPTASAAAIIDNGSTSFPIVRFRTANVDRVVISSNGHIVSNSVVAATVTSCGTSPLLVGDDNTGTITVGSGLVTSCTLTFGTSWGATPVCVISDNSTAITGDISSISATSFTSSFSASLGGGLIYYRCSCSGSGCI